MKRLVRTGAALLFSATTGGCYWLASYEDLTSGLGQTADAGDAGVVADAMVNEGASEGATDARGDTGSQDEGGLDGAGPNDAGPFCPSDAGAYVYCQDFDRIDAAALNLGANMATAAVVSTVSVSPPNSMRVEIGGLGANGGFDRSFSFAPRTTRLEFEVSAPVTGQYATLLAINLDDSGPQIRETLNVVISPARTFHVQEYFGLPDGGSEQSDHTEVPQDAGSNGAAWHHVVLSLTVDDGSQTYLSGLTVDGQVLEAARPLSLGWGQGNVNIGVGVQWASGAGPQLYFDNVRADFGL
jgi:hypothetical protein